MNLTPGKETTEHGALQSAQKWIRIGSGIVLAIITSLLSSGLIPPDSVWIAVLSLIATVAAAITGETFVAGHYIKGRSIVKASAAQGVPPENPPQN